MNTTSILAEIDKEIQKLQQARTLLNGYSTSNGRTASAVKASPKRNKMSAEGRARIAAAQRARWAKVAKAARKAA